MIEITGKVVGAEAVTARLLGAGERVRESIRKEIARLTIEAQSDVKRKLSGEVLNVRTGRLRRSITQTVRVERDAIVGRVGTNVEYGRAWEQGFTVRARVIEAINKKALYWPGARHPVRSVFQPERKVGARPFLKPALDAKRSAIRDRITAATVRGIKAS